jgi:hypothetical protein
MNSIYALPEEDIQALEYYYDYFWVNPDKKTWYFLSQWYTIVKETAESIKDYLTANQEEYLIFCDEKWLRSTKITQWMSSEEIYDVLSSTDQEREQWLESLANTYVWAINNLLENDPTNTKQLLIYLCEIEERRESIAKHIDKTAFVEKFENARYIFVPDCEKNAHWLISFCVNQIKVHGSMHQMIHTRVKNLEQ